MIDSEIAQLPHYSSIDFSNGHEISAYNHLLISLMQHYGLLDCRAASTAMSRQLLQQSKEWVKAIEGNIAVTPVHELIVALSGFDLIHRIAFRTPASSAFIGGCYLKSFNERIRGNMLISDTDLYSAIFDRIQFRDKAFFDKPLQWQCLTSSEWYNECKSTGKFRNSSLEQSLHKARILLDKDLFAFTGRNQEQFKRMLSDHYLPSIIVNGTENAETLKAKLAFLRSNRQRFNSIRQAYTIEQNLLTALMQSADTHQLDRIAYSLDAQFKTHLAEAM